MSHDDVKDRIVRTPLCPVRLTLPCKEEGCGGEMRVDQRDGYSHAIMGAKTTGTSSHRCSECKVEERLDYYDHFPRIIYESIPDDTEDENV